MLDKLFEEVGRNDVQRNLVESFYTAMTRCVSPTDLRFASFSLRKEPDESPEKFYLTHASEGSRTSYGLLLHTDLYSCLVPFYVMEAASNQDLIRDPHRANSTTSPIFTTPACFNSCSLRLLPRLLNHKRHPSDCLPHECRLRTTSGASRQIVANVAEIQSA